MNYYRYQFYWLLNSMPRFLKFLYFVVNQLHNSNTAKLLNNIILMNTHTHSQSNRIFGMNYECNWKMFECWFLLFFSGWNIIYLVLANAIFSMYYLIIWLWDWGKKRTKERFTLKLYNRKMMRSKQTKHIKRTISQSDVYTVCNFV